LISNQYIPNPYIFHRLFFAFFTNRNAKVLLIYNRVPLIVAAPCSTMMLNAKVHPTSRKPINRPVSILPLPQRTEDALQIMPYNLSNLMIQQLVESDFVKLA
jgi:hypothetical protein